MNKKNLVSLSVFLLLSLCVFIVLFVYAFRWQEEKDLRNAGDSISSGDNDASEDGTDSEDNTGSDDTVGKDDGSPGDDTGQYDDMGQGDTDESEDGTGTGDGPENGSGDISDDLNTEKAVISDPVGTLIPPPDLIVSNISEDTPILLGFAGDVNLNESSYPAAKYDAEDKDITRCLSEDLLSEMDAVDIMMLNNEFAYSTRGTKEEDKSYTFRAHPKRVEILQKMSVDIVSLANNHALDYGPDALLDTFDTLDSAGIEYVGAGDNFNRAKAPIYYRVGNKTISYVAASHVIFAMDWYATEDRPGMIGTYDPTILLESIEVAKSNSDYVAVFVHWGVERNSMPESYQKNLAKKYIDAGADIVIGCHPHVMQGIELYKGKPIAYSLGNYWFNKSTNRSGMLKVYLNPDGTLKAQLLPVMNKDTFTYLLTGEAEKKAYYNYMQDISFGVSFDENGFITGEAME